ncbi:hypothetical protein [Caloramator sp. Dgby_cultured_2]|uniref:hypothetical protein n=1 Tax=Caloramator sp. Dgby_cultured_2 TaxID=3029174 RepID=UPI00237E6D64|nr:hypothetical protein [Caloramator sp. Dgby_cultured_2]WDU82312.1 hypothetical protein PWK10_11490 [Caloramator sp. Dgby_cultured_2]
MKPNVKKLNDLVKEKFNGNKSAFANALGLDRAQVSKVLKDGTCAGAQFYGALYVFCEKEKLDFRDYIFYLKV